MRFSRVFDLIQSTYATQALFVLTKLGVFETLTHGPKTLAELAEACQAQPGILGDLLAFAVELRFARADGGKYSIAKSGLQLTEISGSWLRPYLLVWGEQLEPAIVYFERYALSGDNAFKAAHGDTLWDFYRKNPEQNELFVAFMQGVTKQGHMSHVVNDLDVGNARTLVDVGGGTGSLVRALAAKYPQLTCIVCDQPSNAKAARTSIASENLANCSFVEANIFDAVPASRDLYTIKHVLHDWDDANAARILSTIAKAMRTDSKLVILEGLLDRNFDGSSANPEYLHSRNFEQRAWTLGRVRRSSDFANLCAQVGLRTTRISHSNSVADLSYIECEKT